MIIMLYSHSRLSGLFFLFRRYWYTSPLLQRGMKVLLAIVTGISTGLLLIFADRWQDVPILPISLVAGIVFVGILMRRPEWIVLAVVGTTNGLIRADSLPIFGVGPLQVSIPEAMTVALLGLAVIRSISLPGVSIVPSPLLVPLFMFFVAVVIAVAQSLLVNGGSLGLIIPLLRSFLFWTLLFSVLHLVRTPQQITVMLYGLWGLAGVLSVGMIFPDVFVKTPFLSVDTFALSTAGQDFGGIARVFSPAERILYIMLPFTVASLALAAQPRIWLRTGLLVLLLTWLFLSFQRNYWLTTAFNLGLLVMLLPAKARWTLGRRLAPVILLIVVGVVVYYVSTPQTVAHHINAAIYRLETLGNDPGRIDSSIRWRLAENHHALRIIQEEPVLGIGLAVPYRPRMVNELEVPLDWYMHNTYLWIAVMMGAMGLIPFLALCLLYLARAYRNWQCLETPLHSAACLGFGVAFAGMMISNMVAPNFIQSPALSIYPVIQALSEAMVWNARTSRQHQEHYGNE